jgi:hypothetical protein
MTALGNCHAKKKVLPPVVLVAGQADAPPESVVVSDKEGQSLAYRFQCLWLPASARTGENIRCPFSQRKPRLRESNPPRSKPKGCWRLIAKEGLLCCDASGQGFNCLRLAATPGQHLESQPETERLLVSPQCGSCSSDLRSRPPLLPGSG